MPKNRRSPLSACRRARWRSGLAAMASLAIWGASPATAAIVNGPTSRDPYEMVTMGDSYAAGEGAPDRAGQYNGNGDLVGDPENWDTRFAGSSADPGAKQDSSRCHRSGHTSASAVARALLQTEFPDVVFDWVSVACAGASIVQVGKIVDAPPPNKGGVLTPYDGVDDLRKRGINEAALQPAVFPPQLSQVESVVDARPEGPTKRIDALLMNLGGNDAGFGDIVSACLNINFTQSTNWGDCSTNQRVQEFVPAAIGRLPDRFDRLASALTGHPRAGDPALTHTPGDVFLTEVPNPLHPTATTFCAGQNNDPDFGNIFERNLTSAESQWLEANVLVSLNREIANAAAQHGWTPVTSFVNQFIGHAICNIGPPGSADENWINTNQQSLFVEGELNETDGAPIAVGAGIAHPNADGYAAIGASLFARMRPFVVARYTPATSPVTTGAAQSGKFSVSLSDGNLRQLRSGYWNRVKLRKVQFNGDVMPVPSPDGLVDLPYGFTTHDYATLGAGRFIANGRACGPVSRDGSRGCGPIGPDVRISTFVPQKPVNLSGQGGGFPRAVSASGGIRVSWEHADSFAVYDTRRSIIRVRRKDNGVTVASQSVAEPFTGATVVTSTRAPTTSSPSAPVTTLPLAVRRTPPRSR